MKRTFALLAVVAMLAICVIPMADTSDADPAPTTITSYFFNDSKDISTASNITISIIYYDGVNPGKIVGKTTTIDAKDSTTGCNRFSMSITPETDLTKNNYYFSIYMDGFSVKSTPHSVNSETTSITMAEGVKECYRIVAEGSIVANTENIFGNTSTDVFTVQSATGTVTGTVKNNTTEPTYLNGVKVTIYDLETENELTSAYTSNHGEYNMQYNTGDYGIKFELNGYDTVDKKVSIGQNATATVDADMKQNQSYFGLDLSHVLMILGGAVAIVLLLFAVFMRIRVSKR